MAQVFISYSSKDIAQANEIVEALESQGIACWIAPRNISIGSDYMNAIPRAIRECPFFLVLLSRHSQDSEWVKKELSHAIKQHREIFPLMIENFTIQEGFDFTLDNVQIRPFYQDRNACLREVITRVQGQPPHMPPVMDATGYSPEQCFEKGSQFFKEKNYDQAILWLSEAYRRGQYSAANYLGICWYYQKDYVNASKWYDRAHSHGDKNALANKGLCYMDEARRNWKEAEKLFRDAAGDDQSGAMYYLGEIYENGHTRKPDLRRAAYWYDRAREHGDDRAEDALKRVRDRIAAGQKT